MINKAIAAALALALSGAVVAGEGVDINQADVEQLAEALHGVGESKAAAIVEFREENGPFADIDELVEVRGIGLRTVDQNREEIVVSSSDD